MNRRTVLVFLVLLTLIALPVFAQDPMPTPIEPNPPIIIEPPCCGGVFTNPEWMSIDYHRVNINVENQIAATTVNMQFTNNGEGFVEGTFLFPLPEDAAVDNLVMFINGQPIEAKLLRADEARAIYDEIVRQYRDPALLEYVGRNAIQANVFPIPPGESRRIELGYSQILEADNGLVKVIYPLENTATKGRMVDSMSLSVTVDGNDPISNIYSPSHNVAVSREGGTGFRAGFESANFVQDGDFVLYYGLENDRISVNMLDYRESADEDGFFMLLVQPPVTVPEDQLVPKDVILVIDQSGSMDGQKWEQAQSAASYVLDNLNEADRFNVVVFSTGWRVFSNRMEPSNVAPEAADWVNGMFAEGGTDINGALLEALRFADTERPTTILFLTDGLATEGIVETPSILENLDEAASNNVRIFTFGVGDDVDTLLLDSITRDFRGASSYVRPSETIDEEVAALYNKVAAPVLTDVVLDTGDVRTDLVYPNGQLPDLFAGEQLTIVGRYRQGADDVTITISGEVNGEPISYTYDELDFRDRAGGEPFIARLWATRRIGDLLNTIRLNGESEELVDSVVTLSLRYGIITPYTSFLIEEDDILSQSGRDLAEDRFRADAQALNSAASGSAAVDAADSIGGLADAEAPMAPPAIGSGGTGSGSFAADDDGTFASEMDEAEVTEESMAEGGEFNQNAPGEMQQPIIAVNDKTFLLQDGIYIDTTFNPDDMETVEIAFLSDAYFDLLIEFPALADYFSVAEQLIVVYEGVAYEVVLES
jgi:Ca-activated chloride channel family protein